MSVLLWAALLAAGQPHTPAVHATDIKSDFDDALTDRFADALRKALPKAKHLRPEGGDDTADVYLTVLFPVTDDGKRFDYAVDLMKVDDNPTPDRLASFTGTCRESAIDACAQGIIVKADKIVGKD
jgi:hypothetical protein